MDAGAPKPVAGTFVTGEVRPPAGALPASVATDLPVTKAVGAAAGIPALNAMPAGQAGADFATEAVLIDPQSREVIYRALDACARQVARQAPDEALLRNRAYRKSIESGSAPVAPAQADLET